MIKNERQYKITKAQAERFFKAIAEFTENRESDSTNSILHKATIDALRSQYFDLKEELDEYEALKSGKVKIFEASEFGELANVLIKARIARGLSQKDLATMLNMKEQQLQRYEATEYSSASLNRLKDIARALKVKFKKEIFLSEDIISLTKLLQKLKEVGIEQDFVFKRLIPQSLINEMETNESSLNILKAGGIIARIFGWSLEDIFGDKPLQLDNSILEPVRFKKIKGFDNSRITAYTFYLIYLSQLMLEVTQDLKQLPIPGSAKEIRSNIIESYGEISFINVLRYVWDLGIPVLPLMDSNPVHGACLRFKGRNIIIVKQKTSSYSRWLFDLLHELFHAKSYPDVSEFIILDEYEYVEKNVEEQIANRFAGDVLLDSRADELADKCYDEAKGRVEYLKNLLPNIARTERVNIDALANYMAYRISLDGINWWGAAQNLQREKGTPWIDAKEEMLKRIDLKNINEQDRELLLQTSS